MPNLVFQRIVPAYRVAIFERLYEQCGLIACHSREAQHATLASAAEKLHTPNEQLRRIYLGSKETAALQNVLPPLRKYRPRIVISEFAVAYLSLWLLLFLRPLFAYKVLLWTHGLSNEEVLRPFHGRRGTLAAWLLRRADGIICYSAGRAALLQQALGRSCPPCFVAPNTLDTRRELDLCAQFSKQGREKVRAESGMHAPFQLVYIGRLLPEKRIDLILQSFELIAAQVEAELHIIGDGPEAELVQSYAARMPNIRAHGAIWDAEQSGAILFASDLCINPGYVGLSIVHTFCYKTPMLTCPTGPNGPWHSPEIEYLKDGVNGLYAASDAAAIADKVVEVLRSPVQLAALSTAAFATAREECSLENMVRGFAQALAAHARQPKSPGGKQP